MVGVYNIEATQDWVYKSLHIKHPVAIQIRKTLRQVKHDRDFHRIIENACRRRHLGFHIVKGYYLGQGAYKSPRIHGHLLSRLTERGLGQISREDLTFLDLALEQLQTNIRLAGHGNRCVDGDWALHNLIWTRRPNRITNIDLEGFYSYRRMGSPLRPDWTVVENQVNWIIQALQKLRKRVRKHQCRVRQENAVLKNL